MSYAIFAQGLTHQDGKLGRLILEQLLLILSNVKQFL